MKLKLIFLLLVPALLMSADNLPDQLALLETRIAQPKPTDSDYLNYIRWLGDRLKTGLSDCACLHEEPRHVMDKLENVAQQFLLSSRGTLTPAQQTIVPILDASFYTSSVSKRLLAARASGASYQDPGQQRFKAIANRAHSEPTDISYAQNLLEGTSGIKQDVLRGVALLGVLRARNPNDYQPHFLLGKFYAGSLPLRVMTHSGPRRDAFVHFTKAHEIEKNDPHVAYYLAQVYQLGWRGAQTGEDIAIAVRLYEKALALARAQGDIVLETKIKTRRSEMGL